MYSTAQQSGDYLSPLVQHCRERNNAVTLFFFQFLKEEVKF